MISRVRSMGWFVAVWLMTTVPLAAQGTPASKPPTSGVGFGGFVDLGTSDLLASDSFDAVFGRSRSPSIGVGGRVIWRRLFVEIEAGRQRFADGQRAFKFGDEVFGLGIPVTITLVPVNLSGGYRLRPVFGLTPYVGGGIGLLRFTETSDFADAGENTSDTFTAYHVSGGAELRLHKWIAVSGGLQLTSVPGAIGSGGLSQEFGESNLGGTTFRVRLVIGG